MWVAMSAAEREEFLAGVHVGVLILRVARQMRRYGSGPVAPSTRSI